MFRNTTTDIQSFIQKTSKEASKIKKKHLVQILKSKHLAYLILYPLRSNINTLKDNWHLWHSIRQINSTGNRKGVEVGYKAVILTGREFPTSGKVTPIITIIKKMSPTHKPKEMKDYCIHKIKGTGWLSPWYRALLPPHQYRCYPLLVPLAASQQAHGTPPPPRCPSLRSAPSSWRPARGRPLSAASPAQSAARCSRRWMQKGCCAAWCRAHRGLHLDSQPVERQRVEVVSKSDIIWIYNEPFRTS